MSEYTVTAYEAPNEYGLVYEYDGNYYPFGDDCEEWFFEREHALTIITDSYCRALESEVFEGDIPEPLQIFTFTQEEVDNG